MHRPISAVRAIAVLVLVILAVCSLSSVRGIPPANAGRDEVAAALQAALSALNGVPASECTANGQLPPSGRDTCVSISPTQAAQAGRGLVAAQAFLSPDLQPFIALIGRDADGAWGLWFTAPAAYVPIQLPSDARACAMEGLAVRSAPLAGSDIVGSLPAETVTSVDRFVLALPGTWRRGGDGVRGSGWYYVAGSVQGWVDAQGLVVADAGCELALP